MTVSRTPSKQNHISHDSPVHHIILHEIFPQVAQRGNSRPEKWPGLLNLQTTDQKPEHNAIAAHRLWHDALAQGFAPQQLNKPAPLAQQNMETASLSCSLTATYNGEKWVGRAILEKKLEQN